MAENGGTIHTGFEASAFEAAEDDGLRVKGKREGQEVKCRYALTCAGQWFGVYFDMQHEKYNISGLYSDRVAQMSGCSAEPKIVPFRGEYLLLSKEKAR